jgi:hypothetical protein
VDDRERHRIVVQILHLAKQLTPRPIQHGDAFAPPHAQNMDGMMGLTVGQAERWLAALVRRNVESVHLFVLVLVLLLDSFRRRG